MNASRIARNFGKYLFSSNDMIVDIGFVLQGNTYQELPERILGGFRLIHLDLSANANLLNST